MLSAADAQSRLLPPPPGAPPSAMLPSTGAAAPHAPVGVAPQVAVLSHPPPNPMAAQAAVLSVPKPAPKKRAPKKVCESCQDKKATHGLKPRPGSDLDLSKRWCAACARQQAGETPAPARTLLRR